VQLDLESETICRRTSDLSYSRFGHSLKTFYLVIGTKAQS